MYDTRISTTKEKSSRMCQSSQMRLVQASYIEISSCGRVISVLPQYKVYQKLSGGPSRNNWMDVVHDKVDMPKVSNIKMNASGWEPCAHRTTGRTRQRTSHKTSVPMPRIAYSKTWLCALASRRLRRTLPLGTGLFWPPRSITCA
jgi:hypothetical protein